VAADPGCETIIQPYLRGQDVERWAPRWQNLWMIVMKSSSDHPWPWADAGLRAEQLFSSSYPALYAHFKKYEISLRTRQDHGRHWWELRPCAYWTALGDAKIIYNDITWHLELAFDASGYYINNTVYFLPTDNAWLLVVLNAPVWDGGLLGGQLNTVKMRRCATLVVLLKIILYPTSGR
jgi:hypothetical protein